MSVLPGTMFRVALANDHLVLAHISGKMRKRFIRLTVGDRVRMQMSPYDTAKARIVYRLNMARPFYFDPPRRKTEPKAGADLKSLLVRCPSTSKLTDTGRTIEQKLWRKQTAPAKIYLRALWGCPQLDQGRRCVGKTGFLK